jgi:hypothetical protein
MNLNRNTMKRIIYFLSIILISELMYSCYGQYDNIEKYATEETVYIGRFSDFPYVMPGYKRVEIELLGEYVGRVYADDIYLGKGKKTVVEYEEADGVRRIEFDSLCSWVNVTGLTVGKTYVFFIYTEDEYGNRSIPVEALGKPFTDEDLAGFPFPKPHIIPSPTSVDFRWNDDVSMGLSSPLYKFIELVYSYVDKDNKTVSGRLTARDSREEHKFSVTNLDLGKDVSVMINCKIIPIMDSKQIIDTISMIREVITATVTEEEYLAERTLRPIVSAFIDTEDETKATIMLGGITDHLLWTEIRYKQKSTGQYIVEAIDNGTNEVQCTDIMRREFIQIRCAYQPLQDIEYVSEWTNYEPFVLKYDRRDWVVIPRHGNHNWGDGVGSQNLWAGGHPMLILDDDPKSGWHSVLDGNTLPHVLIIDMKESKDISKVFIGDGSYWINVELYLTDNLSITDYQTHTVDWNGGGDRQGDYNGWTEKYLSKIPATVPASWGTAMVKSNGEVNQSFTVSPSKKSRFLIFRFPNSTDGAGYISVNTLEVYYD